MGFYDLDGLGMRKGLGGNPFSTTSNRLWPKNLYDTLMWARYLYERVAKYRSVIIRVTSYFISGINVIPTKDNEEADNDSVESFKERLEDTYNALEIVNNFGLELAAMGNVFVSCERIFSRLLLCPFCSWQMALNKLLKHRDYTWENFEFHGTCPQCHKQVTFKVKDVPAQDRDGRKVRFVFRDPVDIRLQYNILTGDYKFYYEIPSYIKDAIIRGDQVYLETTPAVFIDATKTGNLIEFPPDMFFHARTNTLTPMDRLYKGYGTPLFLPSFAEIIKMAYLAKFTEAITQDYITPLRIISPEPANLKAGIEDPNRMPMSGATFRNFITNSLKRVRDNPTTFVVSPVPVQTTRVGGDAKELAPVDLLEYTDQQFLSNCNIPQELGQSSFQVVAPTMGMRCFERSWLFFAKSLHKFTAWVGEKICDIENVENIRVDLDVTSFVEDDMNKQVLLSLMQGGVIAKTNVLKRLGVDFNKDLDQRMQEQKAEQEAAMKMQTQDEGAEMVQSVMPPPGSLGVGQAQMNMQAMMGGGGEGAPAMPGAPAAPAAPMGAPAGGMPAGAGGAGMEQVWQEAMERAQQLYNAPPNVRRSELVNLKATNPQMHSFVKSFLEQMEQDVASDAVAQSKTPQG